ncbi:AbgT family transporter [Eubacterium multiforme]|uniref:Aminobenzoyl-glutamate transport protein n=1 Tax=Eubacterium multiforme TaxID=83339 RepID=A0ABT9UVS5_9FIRM|nr:AbgT family transporter [Eubacterium multiforme]MDQ0150426.1 aminobenzoyl-glutamate transport protein [Eubacterium multiforme]
MIKGKKQKESFIEKFGKKIPDPVIIFIILYAVVIIGTIFMGGMTFETLGADGGTVAYEIKNMFKAENFRWIFDNALLNNWLAYGGGVLGTILIVMLGVGLAEESGLLTTLIKKIGLKVSDKFLPIVLVFLGIMSSIATDAGYIILIPLAGLLYVGLKKNPLIGMAAAFAGVSAGFSANLIPSTPIDVIVGNNTKVFAEGQGVPFLSQTGQALNPATMHYIFIVVSTVLLSIVGYFITVKFVKPRLEKEKYVVPEDMNLEDFTVKEEENKALKFAGLGFLIGILIVIALHFGPLAPFVGEDGATVKPIMNNIILIITFLFFIPGLFFGMKIGKFKNAMDIVRAMSKQMGGMGYILVLTFFSYNFLALLSYSNIGTYITYLGATFLQSLGIDKYPIILLIGFIVITSIINLFVGGLTSKWMLLGPIFIPMLYQVNSNLTPDFVSAAYRLADSSTNVISPLMAYSGVILVFMRKYKPEYTLGDMIRLMLPYSIGFLICWTILLVIFFLTGIPLGV